MGTIKPTPLGGVAQGASTATRADVMATAVLRARTPDDHTATDALDVIGRQSRRVSQLINDLLDVARIERDRLRLDMQHIDLRAIVAEAVAPHRPQLERRGHALALDLGAEPAVVEADPDRLVQVVSNLVDNAAKYTPAHGRISVSLSREGATVVLTVRDTGIGVPAEHAQSIFEPFAQLPESRRHAEGGLGLGLALVRALTELHGGTVSVVSAGAGQGSAFLVRLPARQGTALVH